MTIYCTTATTVRSDQEEVFLVLVAKWSVVASSLLAKRYFCKINDFFNIISMKENTFKYSKLYTNILIYTSIYTISACSNTHWTYNYMNRI